MAEFTPEQIQALKAALASNPGQIQLLPPVLQRAIQAGITQNSSVEMGSVLGNPAQPAPALDYMGPPDIELPDINLPSAGAQSFRPPIAPSPVRTPPPYRDMAAALSEGILQPSPGTPMPSAPRQREPRQQVLPQRDPAIAAALSMAVERAPALGPDPTVQNALSVPLGIRNEPAQKTQEEALAESLAGASGTSAPLEFPLPRPLGWLAKGLYPGSNPTWGGTPGQQEERYAEIEAQKAASAEYMAAVTAENEAARLAAIPVPNNERVLKLMELLGSPRDATKLDSSAIDKLLNQNNDEAVATEEPRSKTDQFLSVLQGLAAGAQGGREFGDTIAGAGAGGLGNLLNDKERARAEKTDLRRENAAIKARNAQRNLQKEQLRYELRNATTAEERFNKTEELQRLLQLESLMAPQVVGTGSNAYMSYLDEKTGNRGVVKLSGGSKVGTTDPNKFDIGALDAITGGQASSLLNVAKGGGVSPETYAELKAEHLPGFAAESPKWAAAVEDPETLSGDSLKEFESAFVGYLFRQLLAQHFPDKAQRGF